MSFKNYNIQVTFISRFPEKHTKAYTEYPIFLIKGTQNYIINWRKQNNYVESLFNSDDTILKIDGSNFKYSKEEGYVQFIFTRHWLQENKNINLYQMKYFKLKISFDEIIEEFYGWITNIQVSEDFQSQLIISGIIDVFPSILQKNRSQIYQALIVRRSFRVFAFKDVKRELDYRIKKEKSNVFCDFLCSSKSILIKNWPLKNKDSKPWYIRFYYKTKEVNDFNSFIALGPAVLSNCLASRQTLPLFEVRLHSELCPSNFNNLSDYRYFARTTMQKWIKTNLSNASKSEKIAYNLITLSNSEEVGITGRGNQIFYLKEKYISAEHPETYPDFRYNVPTHIQKNHSVFELKTIESNNAIVNNDIHYFNEYNSLDFTISTRLSYKNPIYDIFPYKKIDDKKLYSYFRMSPIFSCKDIIVFWLRTNVIENDFGKQNPYKRAVQWKEAREHIVNVGQKVLIGTATGAGIGAKVGALGGGVGAGLGALVGGAIGGAVTVAGALVSEIINWNDETNIRNDKIKEFNENWLPNLDTDESIDYFCLNFNESLINPLGIYLSVYLPNNIDRITDNLKKFGEPCEYIDKINILEFILAEFNNELDTDNQFFLQFKSCVEQKNIYLSYIFSGFNYWIQEIFKTGIRFNFIIN